MMTLKKIFTALLIYLFVIHANGQTDPTSNTSYFINPVILDTIKTELNSARVRMLWLTDTISISIQNKEIDVDATLEMYREDLKDRSLWRAQPEIDK